MSGEAYTNEKGELTIQIRSYETNELLEHIEIDREVPEEEISIEIMEGRRISNSRKRRHNLQGDLEMEIYDKESYREVALETLADKEHEQWRSWINYCIENYDLPDELVQKWKSNDVDYNELPEEEKEKDRKWARKVLESDRIKVAKFSCMFCSRRFDRDELEKIAPVGFSNNDYTVDDLSPEIQKEIEEADKDASEILYVWKCVNCAENHREKQAIRDY